ncbi:MAG: hypothetical protein IJ326_05385 [Lachnospiraceae bacterium]|nr:hypothetical protein [Lachnospiraceae bacterium]
MAKKKTNDIETAINPPVVAEEIKNSNNVSSPDEPAEVKGVEVETLPPATAKDETLLGFTVDEIKEADKHAKRVVSELGKAEKAFIQVACEMAWLYCGNRWQALETNMNFEEFAKARFGFKKSQAYALVDLVNRFGDEDENGNFKIDAKYKDYSQTQLVNIMRLTNEQIAEHITPKMTVAEIKKIVKELNNREPLEIEGETADAGQTDETEQDENIIDVNAKELNVNDLMTFADFETFEGESDTLFNLVNNAFKEHKACKVRVCVEW